MSLIKCPECKREVSSQANTCPHCGVQIYNNIKRCPICGTFVLMNETQCPQCHAKFIVNTAAQQAPVGYTTTITDNTSTISEPNTPPVNTWTNESEPPIIQEEPKTKKHHYGCLIILLLLLIGGGAAYYYYYQQQEQREAKLYAQLVNCHNPENFKDFLDDFPESEHKADVMQRLSALEKEITCWQKAESSLDKQQLLDFIKEYPASPFSKQAAIMIDSLDWKKAEKTANIRAFETYMANHDTGNYYTQARQKRDSLIKVNDSIAKAKKAAEEARKKEAEKTTAKKNAKKSNTSSKKTTAKKSTKKR